ncbi:MAG: hypothetical protein IPK87_14560 [Planctomycetes bacterium]|nr:hypothetical protein [Planctomycetota bacterium]
MSEDWPFDDPKNVASITTPQVMRQGMPVLLVSHDADDGCWQFLHGDVSGGDKGMVVGLSHMVDLDPTLRELADLPLGWQATRTQKGAPWHRHPKPTET